MTAIIAVRKKFTEAFVMKKTIIQNILPCLCLHSIRLVQRGENSLLNFSENKREFLLRYHKTNKELIASSVVRFFRSFT